MSSRKTIQVCIKVRPLLPKERDSICLWAVKNNTLVLVDSHTDPYIFDFIFDQAESNQIIFEKMAKPIVCACVEGFNGTIFAYGQTSSGKTYTMMGDEKNPGVMVLAVKEVFKQIQQSLDRQFLIRVGYIEIYNEKIYDLLNKTNQDLKIYESATGIVSVNCEENIITSEEELLNYLCLGNKERTVGETNMNERSSRSHAIFRIIIESRKTDKSEESVTQSVLNLVDLAGSERADQSGARGARLKEGGHINKSLLFLSNVIQQLSDNEDHKFISYRDSKLTRILQASLGGNALTSIICTIKPTTVDETQSTLNFAMRAKTIKNKPQLNEMVSDATMMKRLEREIRELKIRLDEASRKNESQTKVGQLEQRIENDMLKIISCNSLREKRRRTWCSASSLNSNAQPSNLPVPVSGSNLQRSQLPKPSFFKTNITARDHAPRTVSVFKSFDATIEETAEDEFKPAELHNFNTFLSPYKTPKSTHLIAGSAMQPIRLSTTPNHKQLGAKTLEKVEQDFLELREFTNLEKELGVKHEHYDALKEKFDLVSYERDQLKKERLLYMLTKDELVDTKESLAAAEKRCEQLEVQVTQIHEYELQLTALKQTNKQLEMENREAVSLQFKFERLQNKSQLRESELLTALDEKNTQIAKLQESLETLTAETLRNSKELQFREQTACEVATPNSNETAACNICVKCVDLQRLLEENKQVTAAFEKLTLEYDKLQVSLKQMSSEAARAQTKLDELDQAKCAEAAECDAMRQEIAQIRAKLVEVQTAYEQTNCDRKEKTESCAQLNGIVATAKVAMQILQEKYDKLELSWQQQQHAIEDIQAEYDAIQLKYDSLQAEYGQLSQSKGDTQKLYEHLQCENKNLQTEIALLKTRVEEAQRDLLEDRSHGSENADLKTRNAQLKLQLAEFQKQFNSLEQENSDLSNQLIESIQESDSLREKCMKLEQENSLQQQTLSAQLKAHMTSDSQYSDVDSIKSSGVCTESSEPDIDHELLQRFQQLTATLRVIELAYDDGRRCVFRAKESIDERTSPALKLCVELSQEIAETGANCTDDANGARVCMQGMLKQNRFHIVEIDDEDDEKELQTYVAELEKAMEEKNMLLDATEHTIKEMSEQLMNLESALLEKSVIVEKVEGYQRQIESLEEENAKITTACEELQEKVRECTMNESQINSMDSDRGNDTLSCNQQTVTELLELENLKAQKLKLESELSTLKAAFEAEKATLQEKSELIEQLQCDIGALTAARSTFEVQQTALQAQLTAHEATRHADKELVDSLRAEMLVVKDELVANTKLIAELEANVKEAKGQLDTQKQASLVGMDGALAKLKATYEEELSILKGNLEAAKCKLTTNEKKYKDEVNRVNLELYEKLELSECEYRNNIQKYNRDWERSRDSYEMQLADLKAKLVQHTEEQERRAEAANAALDKCNAEHGKALAQLKQEKHELESTNDGNQKLLEKLQQQLHDGEQYVAANAKLTETAKQLEAKCHTLEADRQRAAHEHTVYVTELQQEMSELRVTHVQHLATYADLKTGSDAKLEALKLGKMKLQAELEECRQMVDDLCKQLAESVEQLDDAVVVRNTQLEDYERLAKQHDQIKTELTALQEAFEQQQNEYKSTKATAEERAEVLELKIDALKQELHSAQQKAARCEQLSSEQARVEGLLRAALKDKSELEQTLAQKTEVLSATSEVQATVLAELRETLSAACTREQLLEKKCQALAADLAAEQCERQKQSKDVESAISELQLKYETLQVDKTKLEALNSVLAAQLVAANKKCKECIALGEELANLKLEHSGCEAKRADMLAAHKALEERMVSAVEEAGRCSKNAQEELCQAKLMLAKSDVNYRKLMQNREAAYKETKMKLEGTVSCLLLEKRKQEDKIAELEQLTKRLDVDWIASQRKADTNANLSWDSNASTSSPTTRKSGDRTLGEHNQLKAINVNVEDKIYEKQQKTSLLESEGRRNRRMSTHDERRRQSYWGATRDVGLMTDPLDINCKCAELSAKLEDSEKKLYIREGQVKSLRMDLKNHPLKDENALLKKRLQEEQEKSRIDLKRLKQKNHDLVEKINVLIIEQRVDNVHAAAPMTPPTVVVNAVTQTDGTGNDCLQKLQSQYNDLMQICRFRYNLVKELEQKIIDKENASGSSNVTSLEMGQINSLKTQVESLEKELSDTKYKLDHAKAALLIRRKRIEELEGQVASNAGKSPGSAM